MRNLIFGLSTFFVFSFATGANLPTDRIQTVNAVIGDAGFFETFGVLPGQGVSEQLRIESHLAYVENVLRSRDCNDLPVELQNRRAMMLDLLRDYRNKGEFPVNYDYPDGRIPCFIDRNGSICAVGYLIEMTAGRTTAEEINGKYQYNTIQEMEDPIVQSWIASSGLTVDECAMIQPSYSYYPGPIQDNYTIPLSALGGLNLSASVLNSIQIAQGSDNKVVPFIGLITGSASVIGGIMHYENAYYGYPTGQNSGLSMFSIGMGTTTVLLSTWNLISNKEASEQKTSWNLYSFPAGNQQQGVGLRITRRL